jgi:GNAT superfamily N-acetyltransferase
VSAPRIRPATRDDIPLLVDFTLQEAREAEGHQLDRARVTRAITAAFDHPHLAWYRILEEEGRPLGSISLLAEWSDWNGAPYWWVQCAFLLPEARGRGLVTVLLDHAEAEARAAGALELRLHVHPANAAAVRAYEKNGFTLSDYRVYRRIL